MPSTGSPTYRRCVLRGYRFMFRPGWIVFHLFAIAVTVTMILLGRWQLHVSESKHFSLQNFGYTIQWWLFAAFALYFWLRIVRDHARRTIVERPTLAEPAAEPAAEPRPPVTYRRYVMPTAPAESSDPVHTAYNEYLASLAARDAEEA